MSKKIEITKKQAQQFNRMLVALITIMDYDNPEAIRKEYQHSPLDENEALAMAYENMQATAKQARKGIRVLTWVKDLSL